MSTDITQPSGPECARYTALMPQMRHDTLVSSVARSLQGHLEHCPYCQARFAAYDQLDAKLRAYARNFASTAPAADAIIQTALATSTIRATGATPAQHAEPTPHKTRWLPDIARRPSATQEVRSMRFTRQHPMVATVAALLVIVMAAALFTTFARPGLGLPGPHIHTTPTATSLPSHHAISAQQAWGTNAAILALDTQIDATHVFRASTISPDGKLLLGYLTPTQGTVGAQEQLGYYDIATQRFISIGISQPWPASPSCCQTDGRYLLAVLDTAPGATCGLCHRIYTSYDMETGHVWQIAKGTDYDQVQNTVLDHGLVLLNTGQGIFEANLAAHSVTRLALPMGSQPDVRLESFVWPYLLYSVPTPNSPTPATRAHNLTTQADVALSQLDTLQAKGNIGATITGDTLFITQTTNIDATHATTTLFEDDAFSSSNAAPHALASYEDQLSARAANTRLVLFFSPLIWDRTEQRFVTLAADGQQAGQVNVALSGHFLVVIRTNDSSEMLMPQHVTIYDTTTLPTTPSP